MVMKDLASKKVLIHLLKDFSSTHTITNLAKELSLSRVGVWKTLNRLESYISIKPVGGGKTSTSIISLNWRNPLVEKILAFYLTEEALEQKRWQTNFHDLEQATKFLVLYGSILHFSREAKDIDILGVAFKNNFLKIQSIVNNLQKIEDKKIHSINFTLDEFKLELEKPNKVFIDAIKKGVVLFGQENFVKFIKGIQT